MKLVSFVHDCSERYGIAVQGGVVDIPGCDAGAPPSIIDFIRLRDEGPSEFSRLLAECESGEVIPNAEVQFLPCIPHPSKIICLGVNYHDHAAEGGNKVADYPTIFLRGPSSLIGHLGKIPLSRVSDKLDYEAELALVIGKAAKDVTEERALDHVFGYACFNDATFRDYQRKTTQWTIGKNFDATGGFGPWIVLADELPPGAVGLHIESATRTIDTILCPRSSPAAPGFRCRSPMIGRHSPSPSRTTPDSGAPRRITCRWSRRFRCARSSGTTPSW